ncbi:hypothetical protein QUB56_28255 [Microcoleus sp. AR_TQ3_B6]|uniref:hypothetical protein n=1 Tax=Microcoleus sp. AR_TQ3_B6 TaxID=3055284 RepID=UPI002FD1B0F1
MPNGSGGSSGKIELTFKTEKSFSTFGKQFAKCYSKIDIRATLSRPQTNTTNTLQYQFDFNAECGCDTILGHFKKAYEKTINNKDSTKVLTQSLLFLGGEEIDGTSTEDYTAKVVQCTNKLSTYFHPRRTLQFQSAAAIASPNTYTNATAIDSQMNYAAPDVPLMYTQPVANVSLYAQAAARSKLKDKGVDITKSDYLKSKDWYDLVVTEMLDLGFTAKVATEGTIQQNTYSGDINIKDIVTKILGAYLGAAELSTFQSIAQLIATDPDNTGVTDFLDFWWKAASYHTNNSSIAWGPISMDQGQPQTTAVYLNIDVSFTDWRSLFVSLHNEKVNITSCAITLDLNMDVYTNDVKPVIMPAIKEQISKHVKNQKLDFG